MTAMTEVMESSTVEPVESVTAAVTDETALIEVFENVLEISQDVEETLEQGDRQQDGQTVCPPAAESSKWAVGARCQAVWSGDGLVYPVTVVSVDGERCRVRFDGYGNEEDMELSALQSPDAVLQTPDSQDWKPGSLCQAVYSVDGLVYPAEVLWVKGQRCRIRFDNYNNEEEQDVDSLLNPNELHGPNRAAATKGGGWKSSSNSDWKRRRRREESQGERGGERRAAWRDDQQNSGGVKERPGGQSRVKEADEKRGNQQRDEADKPTNHSFPFFPPFPPPPAQSASGDLASFLTPPPPPVWMFGGKESGGSSGVDSTSSMLMLWYMCGFHTGSFMAQQQFKSTSKD